MAEILDLLSQLEEKPEDEEGEGEEEDDGTPYWPSAFIPDLYPVFSSSSRSFSSSDSGEYAVPVSDFSDYHVPFPHDFSELMTTSPHIESSETLGTPSSRSDDTSYDYQSLFIADEQEFENHVFVGSRATSGESSRSGISEFGSESELSEHGETSPANRSNSGRHQDVLPADLGSPLCWDFVPIDDIRMNSSEEFDWEEVDDRLDDRGVLSMMVGIEDEETFSGGGEVIDVDVGAEEAGGEVEGDDFDGGRNVIWEVLLAMNNHGMSTNNSRTIIEYVETLSDFADDQEVFINPSDYEFQIGLFVDQDNILRGSPPASKQIVEELPSIMLTEEDVLNSKSLCAVCTDAFVVEERAKLLPCSHVYHSDCILPWLGIRNTCPVCRYELPTDDQEYEVFKARIRAGRAATPRNFS